MKLSRGCTNGERRVDGDKGGGWHQIKTYVMERCAQTGGIMELLQLVRVSRVHVSTSEVDFQLPAVRTNHGRSDRFVSMTQEPVFDAGSFIKVCSKP